MKTGIILLAAGAGKRFGGNKLMAEAEGKALYLHAMDKIDALPEVAFKAVVTGNPAIMEEGRKRGYIIVENRKPELGISRSVRLATEATEAGNPEALMFMVCDQPWLKAATLEEMLRTYRSGILALKCQGQTGNPVIFPKDCFSLLKGLSGDRGGRQIIETYRGRTEFLEIDDSEELRDIDFREDLKKDKR